MTQLAYAEAAAAPEPAALRLEFTGRVGELAPIVAKNVVLTLLTLGVYRFWAKTRVRRYLWSRTSLLGDPFEYTGTGGELLRGFLVALVVAVLPITVYNWTVNLLIGPEEPGLLFAASAPLYAAILFLVGVALHRARRYRFSRTTWRGVRFAQQGSALRFGLMYLGAWLLNAATLFWSYPWTSLRLTGALTNDVWFGDRRFAFAGEAKPLYQRFVAAWLLGLLAWLLVVGLTFLVATTLAQAGVVFEPDDEGLAIVAFGFPMLAAVWLLTWLVMTWYRAREAAYFAACTRYEGLQARYDVTAGALLRLGLGNLLVWLVTLGLGGAFVEMRNLRFVCQRLSFVGNVDPAEIRQSLAPAPGRGEGLAEAFDVGAM